MISKVVQNLLMDSEWLPKLACKAGELIGHMYPEGTDKTKTGIRSEWFLKKLILDLCMVVLKVNPDIPYKVYNLL